MSVLPVVLTVAIDDSTNAELMESIVSHGCIEKISNANNTPDDYPVCTLNTKYYTADVQFHPLDRRTSSIESIINRIEAVVLYMDHSSDSLVKVLNDWEPALRNIDTDAKMLLSKYAIPENQKHTVDEWCMKNEYELIELECNQAPNSDSMADCNEKFGFERFMEALQTHRWSNLKQKTVINTAKRRNAENHKPVKHDSTPFEHGCKTPTNTPIETPPESAFDHFDNSEELYNLFQNLKSMKLNISSLSGTEKLDEAEKVVKTFWNAIGGDANEFSDSDHEFT